MNHDCFEPRVWAKGDRFSIGTATGVVNVVNASGVNIQFDGNDYNGGGLYTNQVSQAWFESVAKYLKPRTAYDEFLDLKPGQVFLIDDGYPDPIKRVKLSNSEYVRLGNVTIITVRRNDGNVMHLERTKLVLGEP